MNPSPPQPHGNGADSRPVVFVVDDEPMLLELNTVILEPLGFRVRAFRDPDTAVRAFSLANPRPVLIVTDYAMHTMNGMDLISACRRVAPDQKIIMVSGTVDETIFHGAPEKPDRFLAKPYQSRQLSDLVRDVLAA
jgi:two-component system, cell cycle sensor histidine kinase and response regulator CckA